MGEITGQIEWSGNAFEIPATNLTLAQLSAAYPAASYRGYTAYTTDQGLVVSSGVAWLVNTDTSIKAALLTGAGNASANATAIMAAASQNITVKLPAGSYFVGPMNLPNSGCQIQGEGVFSTTLTFVPTGNCATPGYGTVDPGTCFQFCLSAGQQVLYNCSLKNITIQSTDTSFTKAAIRSCETSQLVLQDVLITGFYGGDSCGLQTMGHEMVYLKRFHAEACIPIRMSVGLKAYGVTLAGVTIANTAGGFTCTSSALAVGQQVTIAGTLGGTGSITGYTDPKTYAIAVTNGTTTFTLTPQNGLAGYTASFATNVMTLTATATGTFAIGQVVVAAGVTAGTTISSLASGSLGASGSTYNLSTSPGTIGSEAVTSYVPLTTTAGTPTGLTITVGVVYSGDHFHYDDCYLIAGLGAANVKTQGVNFYPLTLQSACVLIDDNLFISNMKWDGTQAWVGGQYGLYCNSPSYPGSICYSWSFKNIRKEQGFTNAMMVSYNQTSSSTYNLRQMYFENCYNTEGFTGWSLNGLYYATMVNCMSPSQGGFFVVSAPNNILGMEWRAMWALSTDVNNLTGTLGKATNANYQVNYKTPFSASWSGLSIPVAGEAVTITTPITGFTITINNWQTIQVLTPAGTLATGTITMCAGPVDNQEINVSTSQTVTALTVSPNSGQSIVGAPTTLAANTGFRMIYNANATTWYRLN